MIAALYTDGQVFTGSNHGDAYSKLNEYQKNSCTIKDGFVKNNKFISEDCQFYLKKIILIRHGDSESQSYDSPITEKGRRQAEKSAAFLITLGLQNYQLISSPFLRCVETAQVFATTFNITFTTDNRLMKQNETEEYGQFTKRIEDMLEAMPEKSLLISHCDFIQKILSLTLGVEPPSVIPNCSTTYIDNNRLLWLCREQ